MTGKGEKIVARSLKATASKPSQDCNPCFLSTVIGLGFGDSVRRIKNPAEISVAHAAGSWLGTYYKDVSKMSKQ